MMKFVLKVLKMSGLFYHEQDQARPRLCIQDTPRPPFLSSRSLETKTQSLETTSLTYKIQDKKLIWVA